MKQGRSHLPSEKTRQSAILKYLNSLYPDVWVVKVVVCNKRGVPDIICCYKGKFIGLEVKVPNAKVPPHQIFQGKLINIAGGGWWVVNDTDDVKKILKEMK